MGGGADGRHLIVQSSAASICSRISAAHSFTLPDDYADEVHVLRCGL